MTDIDLLAVGAHPDDVELGCGGTVAHHARLGGSVAILDLTRGELGSRGTPELRAAEAAAAAAILGVGERRNAELPDGGLLPFDEGQRLAVIRVLRDLRPRVVLAPWHEVRHPDHGHACRLVEEAIFRAGLHKIDTGQEPFRPTLLLYYMERRPFEPSVVVDVTADHDTALEAVAAYGSQFTQASGDDEPATFLTRPEFLEGVIARARYYGDLAGFRFGEPLRSSGPMAVTNPRRLFGATETP